MRTVEEERGRSIKKEGRNQGAGALGLHALSQVAE